MDTFRRITLIGTGTLLVAGWALFPGNRLAAQAGPADPPMAPAWKLKDLDGREVNSGQFKGQVVVVDFWATWCAPCVGEIPGYVALQRKYGPAGVVIVGIAFHDAKGPAQIKKFAEANGINYLLVMGDDDVAEAFGGIEGIPTTFLINRQGRIVHRKMGAMAHGEYERLLQQALN